MLSTTLNVHLIGIKYIHICACVLSHFSCVQFFLTPYTVVHQAPPSMGFSRQEHWSGLPCPPPRNLPDPGIEPMFPVSPALQVDSLPLSHQGSPSTFTLLCNYHHPHLQNIFHLEKLKL